MAKKGSIVVIVVEWLIVLASAILASGASVLYVTDVEESSDSSFLQFLAIGLWFSFLIQLGLTLLLTRGFLQDSASKLHLWIQITTLLVLFGSFFSLRALILRDWFGMTGASFCVYRYSAILTIHAHWRQISDVNFISIRRVAQKADDTVMLVV